MRSLRLVAARTGVDVQSVNDSIAPSIDDIVAMLSPVSRRHQVHFESELDGDNGALPLDAVSEMLTVGVDAILQAGRSARVCLRYSESRGPTTPSKFCRSPALRPVSISLSVDVPVTASPAEPFACGRKFYPQ